MTEKFGEWMVVKKTFRPKVPKVTKDPGVGGTTGAKESSDERDATKGKGEVQKLEEVSLRKKPGSVDTSRNLNRFGKGTEFQKESSGSRYDLLTLEDGSLGDKLGNKNLQLKERNTERSCESKKKDLEINFPNNNKASKKKEMMAKELHEGG